MVLLILAVCSCHVTYAFQTESTLYSWSNGWVFVYELSGSGFESSCNHLINPRIYVITKSPSEGIGTSFTRGYKSLGNDTAMFVLLMESAFWFTWPRNVVASVQVLMTGMIDCLISLAVNSLLFFSFTKSLVTSLMAMVLFSKAAWICWKCKSFALSLDVKCTSQISLLHFLTTGCCSFLARHKCLFYLSFFHKIGHFAKLFQETIALAYIILLPYSALS